MSAPLTREQILAFAAVIGARSFAVLGPALSPFCMKLEALVDGGLSPEESEKVRQHLADCDTCQAALPLMLIRARSEERQRQDSEAIALKLKSLQEELAGLRDAWREGQAHLDERLKKLEAPATEPITWEPAPGTATPRLLQRQLAHLSGLVDGAGARARQTAWTAAQLSRDTQRKVVTDARLDLLRHDVGVASMELGKLAHALRDCLARLAPAEQQPPSGREPRSSGAASEVRRLLEALEMAGSNGQEFTLAAPHCVLLVRYFRELWDSLASRVDEALLELQAARTCLPSREAVEVDGLPGSMPADIADALDGVREAHAELERHLEELKKEALHD